jgi:hypothetical protein
MASGHPAVGRAIDNLDLYEGFYGLIGSFLDESSRLNQPPELDSKPA